jgi:hypothetical protein
VTVRSIKANSANGYLVLELELELASAEHQPMIRRSVGGDTVDLVVHMDRSVATELAMELALVVPTNH